MAKTVRNHYEDIFAHWDSPGRLTSAYTECLDGLICVSNRMGRGYSFEIIRAKTLYPKDARKVGSGIIAAASGTKPAVVEHGPHIPTLVEMAESGGLD